MKTATKSRRGARRVSLVLLAGMLPLASGCVTVAEFRKLEREVTDIQRGAEGGAAGRNRVAELSAQIDDLRVEVQQLEGRLEVSEHGIEEAKREAATARAEAAQAAAAPQIAAPATPAGNPAPGEGAGGAPIAEAGEVEAYRQAYDAWRAGNSQVCVDQFRNFLQTYPASAYADDAAYWLADCYFKQGDQARGLQNRRIAIRRRRVALPGGQQGARRTLSAGRGAVAVGAGLWEGGGESVRTGPERISGLRSCNRGETAARSARIRLTGWIQLNGRTGAGLAIAT